MCHTACLTIRGIAFYQILANDLARLRGRGDHEDEKENNSCERVSEIETDHAIANIIADTRTLVIDFREYRSQLFFRRAFI